MDTVSYGYELVDTPAESITEPPQDGAMIFGMFLEGSRWDEKTHKMQESRSKELYTALPTIHMQPAANRERPATGIYDSPVYKTLGRFGVLSTTGHSTNFVMTLEIPTELPRDHWVNRGVAAFLALKS